MVDLIQALSKSDTDGSITMVGINKGGGTKTTLTVNLGMMAKMLGTRSLVVDCAPEAHTTYSYGYLPHQVHYSLYDLLVGDHTLEEVILPTYYSTESRSFFCPTDHTDPSDPASPTLLEDLQARGVPVIQGPDLIPLRLSATADEKLRGKKMRDFLLAMALYPARKQYDYIICDTNPDLLNVLTINTLYAADWACIPFVPEQLTAIGFKNLIDAVAETKAANQKLQIAGVLTSKVKDMKVHRDILEPFYEILQQQGIHYFQTKIKDSPHKFLTAVNRRSIVVLDDPTSDPALEYWGFMMEYLAIIGGPGATSVESIVQGLLQQRNAKAAKEEEKRRTKTATKEKTSASSGS